jgi:hypothetical protein
LVEDYFLHMIPSFFWVIFENPWIISVQPWYAGHICSMFTNFFLNRFQDLNHSQLLNVPCVVLRVDLQTSLCTFNFHSCPREELCSLHREVYEWYKCITKSIMDALKSITSNLQICITCTYYFIPIFSSSFSGILYEHLITYKCRFPLYSTQVTSFICWDHVHNIFSHCNDIKLLDMHLYTILFFSP